MTQVYLNDTGIPYEQAEDYFVHAAAWATRQCQSYVDYHVQDVDGRYDFIAQYGFNDPRDALMFELKWKNS